MQMGCNPIPSKLSGDWGITAADKLLRKLGESDASNLDLKQPDESDGQTEPKMVLKFGSSGSLQTITKMGRFDPPPKNGNWKMLAWDETKQLMSIQCTLDGQTTEHDVHFIKTDLIELIPPNMAGTGKRIQFRRMK
jgi:hypothetical protein